MIMMCSVDTREQIFLQQVEQSIFANPFTRERHISDCILTGLDERTAPAVVLKKVVSLVREHVNRLSAAGRSSLDQYQGADRQAMVYLFLFFLFHKYLADFDRHILKQNQTSRSLPLACGQKLSTEFTAFGFSRQEILQYIALFFQMRRAFFFINTSLIGASPCMEAMRAHLWETVFTHDIGRYTRNFVGRLEDFSTLLLGETGTGKGLVASAIGRSGFIPYDGETCRFCISFSRAFLAINICQFARELLESELFGHSRGAFTGAVAEHQGVFSLSSGYGAVFLDEIGEISAQTQVKLLKILQDREFFPVGSHTPHRFEGRLIGATNQDLGQRIEQGKFREDFYFRLCTDVITVPPLRKRIAEHTGELEQLTCFLVGRIVGDSDDMGAVVTDTIVRAGGNVYPWPGNVRELEQVIRRILLHGKCDLQVRTHHEKDVLSKALLAEEPDMAELTSRYCSTLFKKYKTLQAVARVTQLDRRTVKKYIEQIE